MRLYVLIMRACVVPWDGVEPDLPRTLTTRRYRLFKVVFYPVTSIMYPGGKNGIDVSYPRIKKGVRAGLGVSV